MSIDSRAPTLRIPFRERVLDNGLRVVVHEDHSDPVVAVRVCYHVGSAREVRGLSGLAHLFEHLMFEGSAHVAAGEHFRRVQNAGGTLNGATSFDRTFYFEVLPANHLELALWLEADRMGALLPALSREKLDNQRDVVKNERRESYENRPYGLVRETLHAALYPEGHPYHSIPIGSMADLDRATLDDVRAFFTRWYGPNNAVLVIAGDVECERAFELAERHFGPVARGAEVGRPATLGVVLEGDRRVTLEDRVQLPQLSLLWPTAPSSSRDHAALRLAAMVLSQNKSAVLDRALTVDRVLARSVSISGEELEIAGQLLISVQAAPRVTLGELESSTRRLIAEVAAQGVDVAQLERMKHRAAADDLWRHETVQGKAASLGEHALLDGDPSAGARELERLFEVDADDVRRAIRHYLADRPAVVLSVVPSGRSELASDARPKLARVDARAPATSEPRSEPRPALALPPIWRASIGAIEARGTAFAELPLCAFHLALPGGRLHESVESVGLATLTAALLFEGTRSLSTTELTDRLDSLGASASASAGLDELTLRFSVLDAKLERGLELFRELVLEPRFSREDFERVRAQHLTQIDTRGDQIRTIAHNAWMRILHGERSVLGYSPLGTRAALERLELEQLREFHSRALCRGARLVFAGSHSAAEVAQRFGGLGAELARGLQSKGRTWSASDAQRRTGRELFLVDKPGAAQSELRLGHLSVAASDPDFYPLIALNYVLGGAFTSRLNTNLRERRGFTYGAHSVFDGDVVPGAFTVATAVHTEVTAAALEQCLHEIESIHDGITEEERELVVNALSQSMLRNYEPVATRLALVDNTSRFGWPDDYPSRRLEWLAKASTSEFRELARRRVHPERLTMLVVGDAAKIEADLARFGTVRRLDLDGAPV